MQPNLGYWKRIRNKGSQAPASHLTTQSSHAVSVLPLKGPDQLIRTARQGNTSVSGVFSPYGLCVHPPHFLPCLASEAPDVCRCPTFTLNCSDPGPDPSENAESAGDKLGGGRGRLTSLQECWELGRWLSLMGRGPGRLKPRGRQTVSMHGPLGRHLKVNPANLDAVVTSGPGKDGPCRRRVNTGRGNQTEF